MPHCTQEYFLFNTQLHVFSQAYQLNSSKTQLFILLQPPNVFISLPRKWHRHLANSFHSVLTEQPQVTPLLKHQLVTPLLKPPMASHHHTKFQLLMGFHKHPNPQPSCVTSGTLAIHLRTLIQHLLYLSNESFLVPLSHSSHYINFSPSLKGIFRICK